MDTDARCTVTRSFAAGLFLMARGFEPIRAEAVLGGGGGFRYFFPSDAKQALDDYFEAKDRLADLGSNTRTEGRPILSLAEGRR